MKTMVLFWMCDESVPLKIRLYDTKGRKELGNHIQEFTKNDITNGWKIRWLDINFTKANVLKLVKFFLFLVHDLVQEL
jgi:hypothetical protein